MTGINHKFKLLIFCLLVITGLSLSFKRGLRADGNGPSLNLSSDKSSVSAGRDLNVSVLIETQQEVGAVDLVLSFDKQNLTLKQIIPKDRDNFDYFPTKEGVFYPDDIINTANETGRIEGLGAGISDSAFVDQTTLLNLKFGVSTQQETDTAVNIEATRGETIDDSNLWDPKGDTDILDSSSVTGLSVSLSGPAPVRILNPLKAETIPEFIQYLINLVFYIALAIAPLMFIIGGYYYLTAAGNPDRIETGRNILIYTGAGIGIMLLAKVLISMIIAALGG